MINLNEFMTNVVGLLPMAVLFLCKCVMLRQANSSSAKFDFFLYK